LGNIAPSQGDYNQIVHGGGHGDYHPIVLAPASVQEAIDLTVLAFDLAEKYRAVVVVLVDGNIGQIMEPATLPEMRSLPHTRPEWAVDGAKGRDRRILTSIYLNPIDEETTNLRLLKRWSEIQANEVRYRGEFIDDAELVLIAFGTAGRVALSAVRAARAKGIAAGLLRPITLSPFPGEAIRQLADRADQFLVVEMNSGQMLDDVTRVIGERAPVHFYGRLGGVVPFPDELVDEIERIATRTAAPSENPRQAWLERMGEIYAD
jgi:2-oxoglutarate ferredoxin oxidoreductase subunit alpha